MNSITYERAGVSDALISLQGYTLLRKDRIDTENDSGGGISYVRYRGN